MPSSISSVNSKASHSVGRDIPLTRQERNINALQLVVANLATSLKDNKSITSEGISRLAPLALTALAFPHAKELDMAPMFKTCVPMESKFHSACGPLFSREDFFDGPGIALNKMYTMMNPHDKKVLSIMLSLLPRDEVTKVLNAKHFPGSGAGKFLQEPINVTIPGLSGGQGSLRCFDSVASDVNRPGLKWLKFSLPNLWNSAVAVNFLGSFEPSKRAPFLGIAQLTANNTSYLVTVGDADKTPIHSDLSVDFFLNGKSGVKHRGHVAQDQSVQKVFSLTEFAQNGEIQAGSVGTLVVKNSDGKETQWLGVSLDRDGNIQEGAIGTKVVKHLDGQESQWESVKFNQDGSLQEGAVGTRVDKKRLNGHEIRWEGVSFDQLGNVQEVSVGTKVVKYPDGREIRWQGVSFDWRSGLIQEGSVGTKVITRPDGTKKRWEGVSFDRFGNVQVVSVGSRTVRDGAPREDGSELSDSSTNLDRPGKRQKTS